MVRFPLIAGNWKMHKTGSEAAAFIKTLSQMITHSQRRVFLSVPFTALEQAVKASQNSPIIIGAQNMHDQEEGAYTGEISARMLKEAGARFVILGHSERRLVFGETDVFINRKVHRAIQEGLLSIVCIGETEEQRRCNATHSILTQQLSICLKDVKPSQCAQLIIAYEPVWAIGTGQTATPSMAQEVHAFIRKYFIQHWGSQIAETLTFLYGGSVKPDNMEQLMHGEDVDGTLVGGASLDPHVFAQIINYRE